LRTLLETAVVRPYAAREITLGDRNLIVSARRVEGGGAVVTFLDVTEIRRLEMVRRDFVANASHELKTPLTAMRGFAETLLEDDPPENLRRDFLGSIRSNTLRLQNLVDDLLDLSRLESGGWVAREEVVEIRGVVEDLWSGLRAKLSDRKLDFSVEGNALVLADEQGLSQVVRNLVDNAIQYTPDGGSIQVKIWEEGPLARMEVRDTGIGIPTSVLPRIFERFFRVDPARSRAEGGTGLGLAIVRHLVDAMGGEVWAESELGQGTSIFVTLLRASEAAEAAEA
jgi:signal transduction histidine kinase